MNLRAKTFLPLLAIAIIPIIIFGIYAYAGPGLTEQTELINKTFLLMCIATFIIVIMVFAYMNKALLKPIEEMQSIATNITLGKTEIALSPLKQDDELGALSRRIIQMRNQIKHQNKSINKLTYFDSLTNLPNRHFFELVLAEKVRKSKQQNKHFTVAILDLDNFKQINDSLGHIAGDKFLQSVSKRIESSLKIEMLNSVNINKIDLSKNFLARLGGDEFVLVINKLELSETPLDKVKTLPDIFATSFFIQGNDVNVSVSVGVAQYPEHGHSPAELFKSADLALYNAKNNGKNKIALYNGQMSSLNVNRLKIGKLLSDAINEEQFRLEFRPRINLHDYSFNCYEAQIRWDSPLLGDVNPMSLIGIAEDSKQINKLGAWVIASTVKQLFKWKKRGFYDFRISINISYLQLDKLDLTATIKCLLALYQVPAEQLEIEITESVFNQDELLVIEILEALKELGVVVTLDNSGIGHASVKNLNRFHFDKVKFAPLFLQSVVENEENQKLFKNILHLAKELGTKTVAKGIETSSMHELILLLGCQEAQGFYYSKTLDKEAAEVYMQSMKEKKRYHLKCVN
ncbi:bifunctional diguanylate cyclase/phosphodiesterase [Glaciecola petra]|uniref:EAL domain-containing protein n=1 Tax=Glaciecola petra TaxID=3075602 RepID=A0ABU2ZTL0_9ALTE|nr:EAL domain-containing protein [Aestuariibacter sp. P117]MDT0594742.1 EAL domain-containing protein [Aestuariibacter sp. P117]